jgi:hypothetical protein
MSLYNQEEQDSLYAATDCLQAPSELEFDFDDVIVNSAAYRRVLAAAQRPILVAQQDDSECLANFPDGDTYFGVEDRLWALSDRGSSKPAWYASLKILCSRWYGSITSTSDRKHEALSDSSSRIWVRPPSSIVSYTNW